MRAMNGDIMPDRAGAGYGYSINNGVIGMSIKSVLLATGVALSLASEGALSVDTIDDVKDVPFAFGCRRRLHPLQQHVVQHGAVRPDAAMGANASSMGRSRIRRAITSRSSVPAACTALR